MKRFSRHYILTAIMGAIAAAIGPGAWAADWQQFDKNERVTVLLIGEAKCGRSPSIQPG